jgi:Flp pilus assembly protein TadG
MTMWKRLAARLGDDERGAIAVQFALLLIPIAILTFGLIDISRASVQKRQLQDALDAATLMAARSTATTNADLDAIGDAALATEMAGLGVTLTAQQLDLLPGRQQHRGRHDPERRDQAHHLQPVEQRRRRSRPPPR